MDDLGRCWDFETDDRLLMDARRVGVHDGVVRLRLWTRGGSPQVAVVDLRTSTVSRYELTMGSATPIPGARLLSRKRKVSNLWVKETGNER
jgi:hypothetical protein